MGKRKLAVPSNGPKNDVVSKLSPNEQNIFTKTHFKDCKKILENLESLASFIKKLTLGGSAMCAALCTFKVISSMAGTASVFGSFLQPIVRNANMSTTTKFAGLNLNMPFSETSTAVSNHAVNESVSIPYDGLMFPGGGINSLTGKATGAKVVENTKLVRLEGADATTDGQATRTTVKVVETAEDLFRQMSMTMSGNAKYGGFSGSASYNRSEMSKFNSQSSIILASTSVVNALEYFTDGRLEEHAVKLAKKDPESFVARFGDSYVQGVLRGGYYLAIVSVVSESRDVQKKIAGSVSASFRGFGSGSGSFSEEMKAYSRFSEINIQFIQRGGINEDHANLGTNFESLGNKINRFATVIHRNPVTISVIASSYKTLDNFPPTAVDSMNRRYQRERLAEYDLQRSKIIGIRNDLEFVQNHPNLFIEPPSHSTLNEWQKKLATKQNLLEKTAQECVSDAEKCKVIEFTLPESIKMPERIDNAIDQEESQKLGKIWHETERGWKGVWRRIGGSRIFEATWTRGNSIEKALLKIRITGSSVQVLRTNSHGTRNGNPVTRNGDCEYEGILRESGKVSGEYSCPWGPRQKWEAKIS